MPPAWRWSRNFNRLAQADANNALLGYFLADALRRNEKWDAAEALYKKLLQQDPAADGHQGLVDIYRRQKQFAPLLKQLGAVVSETGSLDALDDISDTLAKDALAARTACQPGAGVGCRRRPIASRRCLVCLGTVTRRCGPE